MTSMTRTPRKPQYRDRRSPITRPWQRWDDNHTYIARHRRTADALGPVDYMSEQIDCGYGHTVARRDIFAHECPGLAAAAERGRALIERIGAQS